MKVLIIGLGLVGTNICKMLFSSGVVSKLICCDKNISNVKNSFKDCSTILTSVTFEKLDASKESEIKKFAKNADIVVNASLPKFNIKIMKSCLDVGANYLDLASNNYGKAEQLSLHNDFVREGLTAIINAGVSPGLTNLMAKWCSDVLEEIDVLKIRLVEDQMPYWRVWSWSPYLTIEHFASPPIVYDNGRFKIEEPLGSMEDYNFPSPIGKRRTYLIYGDEITTIPNYIELKRLDLKSGGSEVEFVKGLYNLGLFRNDAIKVERKSITPIKVLYRLSKEFNGYSPIDHLYALDEMLIAVSVEAIGIKGFEKSIARIHALPPNLRKLLNNNIVATPTAFSAAAVASALIEVFQNIRSVGVYPLEALDNNLRGNILSNLNEHYNIEIIYEPIRVLKDITSKL
ncbi:MAG: saccharopine dehydrogenase NADP-binding domain-containing protein [Candidatus Methanomethylicia archaeon]